MKKEELVALGLTSKQADSVITGFGTMVPKARLDEKIKEAKEYKDQVAERDTQLTLLQSKAAGNEALQAEITKLQEANQKAQADFEAKLQEQSYNFALDSALSNAKVRNAKAVKALLDIEKIQLVGDKLFGIEEQLKALKKSDGYLFESTEEAKPTFSTKAIPKEGITKEIIMSIKDASTRIKLIQDNPNLFN